MELLRWERGNALYTVACGLGALASAVCVPASKSTDPIMLHALLSAAAQLGHPLFQLFSHPSRAALSDVSVCMLQAYSLLCTAQCSTQIVQPAAQGLT